MVKNFFILRTVERLSSDDVEFVKYIFENSFKENLVLPVQVRSNNIFKRIKIFYLKKNSKYYYCIPLIRELKNDEIKNIYSRLKLKLNKKFKILREKRSSESKEEKNYEDISKIIYNEFLRKKIESGWRQGFEYDKEKKISPNLIEWERLSEKKKKKYINFFKTIIEIYENNKKY